MKRRVGILGGGQLALMLAESLVELGADPAIFDPDSEAPARRRYALGASAPYEDRAALRSFLDDCDVVTYEFENVPASAIRAARSRTPIKPGLAVLEICQHRVREKQAVRAAGAPTVRFVPVASVSVLPDALRAFGTPAIVKTATGGYDGKGQRRYRAGERATVDDFAAGVELVIEEPIDIELEVSCIVARSEGRAVCLPLFENRHRDHILDVTLCPARLPEPAARRVRAIAQRIPPGHKTSLLRRPHYGGRTFLPLHASPFAARLSPHPARRRSASYSAVIDTVVEMSRSGELRSCEPSPRFHRDGATRATSSISTYRQEAAAPRTEHGARSTDHGSR